MQKILWVVTVFLLLPVMVGCLSTKLTSCKATQRCLPANWGERQYCVFGTNGWTCVEYYPDGLPLRMTEGVGEHGPARGATLTEREFDFFGKELQSIADPVEVKGSGSYVHCLSRVYSGASVMTADYSFDLFYYVESDACIKACAWTMNLRSGRMDKLVFAVDTSKKVNASVEDIEYHIGDLTGINKVTVDRDGCLSIEFSVAIPGAGIMVGRMDPSRGRQKFSRRSDVAREQVL